MKLIYPVLTIIMAAAGFSAATSSAADEIPTFHLTIKGHKFDTETLAIPANTKFKLVVKNEDASAEEFDSMDLSREKVIPGGKSAEIALGPLKAGEYHFIGEYHAETAYGSLILK